MRRSIWCAALAVVAGCALYSEVTIQPLLLLPANIERGSDLASMLEKADYLRAIDMTATVEARPRRTAADMGALGAAYLASGRFDEARSKLRAALDLDPFRNVYAQIAWDLSEVEYLSNNHEASMEWAKAALDRGLQVRKWHIDFLESLAATRVYQFSGAPSDSVPIRFGKPDVPRITARLNRGKGMEAIIDSGAVLSIISRRTADGVPVKRLGTYEGTFFGLLGEPIPVTFGMIDTLELGDIVIQNVPVAIMPDDKMRFLVSKKEQKEYRMDLLLGTNLLKEFRLELNFDNNRATFTRLTAADRKPAADQNLFYDGFRPHVRGAVQRRGWYLFTLDTGSEITFLNQSRLATLPVPTFGGGHTATLQGLGGAMKRGAKLENIEIGVGQWAGIFKTLPMYTGNEKEKAIGIIGQNYLKNFNVVIDFGRMRVDLTRR